MFGARVVRQKRERERAERGLLDADSRPTVPYIKVDTIATSASKSSIRRFVITEKAPTSAAPSPGCGPNFMLRDRGVNARLA